MPNPYPPIKQSFQVAGTEDANPAIQLFGRRFFSDQTVAEFLIEFLLVVTSPKKIAEKIIPESELSESFFPSMAQLRNWPDQTPLEYAPKSRLNLKLFALLGASKLDTRHQTHRDHYCELLRSIKQSTEAFGGITPDEVLKMLENLFLGFQRVGGQRTWCAQSFLPIHPEMIAGETIWKKTKASRDNIETWNEIMERGGYFQSSQHNFLARGGEVLYLQICNALHTSQEEIDAWCEKIKASHTDRERCPETIRMALAQGLYRALNACPATVGSLAKFIDEEVEAKTARQTDYKNGLPHYTQCGWCPEDTWPESLLFAVDLLRLCDASLDPIERLALMETACAMQALRTLCAQSARYDESNNGIGAGALGYVWAVSDPEGNNNILKRISRRSVDANLLQIQRAIRHPGIMANIQRQRHSSKPPEKHFADSYKVADTGYGHKLFLALAKRLGLMVPRRGTGARFVLTDHLLRYLVLTTVRPGERMTYDSFMEQVFQRHGMALSGKYICSACEWCGTQHPATFGNDTDEWLVAMLSAAGMLVRLSDSCSMVKNPFGNEREIC